MKGSFDPCHRFVICRLRTTSFCKARLFLDRRGQLFSVISVTYLGNISSSQEHIQSELDSQPVSLVGLGSDPKEEEFSDPVNPFWSLHLKALSPPGPLMITDEDAT